MQIVEVTEFGARSAVVRLQRKGTPLRFVLFPITHLASAEFYADVERRLQDCKIIVAEGIQGPSASTRALTRSYRLLKHKRSLGLVGQDIDYSKLEADIVYPDLTGREMDAGWRQVPWRDRLVFALLVPCYTVWLLLFGTRRVIASYLEVNDLASEMEEALAARYEAVDDLVVTKRDQALLSALFKIHDEHASEAIDVAVVYGAAHVPAIVRGLRSQYGYITRGGVWLDLFTL